MDIQRAKAILSAQFPELDTAGMTRIPEGGDSDTFDVNGAVIVKFPVSEAAAARLVREFEALRYLSGKMPGLVAEPLYCGRPSALFPYPFTGQRKLAGQSGETFRPDPRRLPGMAETAGRLVSLLHTSPAEPWQRLDLPRMSLESPQHLIGEVLVYRELLERERLSYPELARFLNGDVALPSPSPLAPVVSHGDIKGEHVLVDPSSGKISGIVDWADICMADPTVDFSGFVIWLGPGFAARMLDAYPARVDPDFLARAVFYARCHALIRWGESLAGTSDSPRALLYKQLRAAFG